MKIFIHILLFSLLSMANDTPSLVKSDIQLTNYNQRPSIKLQHQVKLKRLALITLDQAKDIASNVCKSPIENYNLTHKGQLLFYRMVSKNCIVKINALDGVIIMKEDR